MSPVDLDDALLARSFGAPTLERAQHYVTSGLVLDLEQTPGRGRELQLSGVVAGSEPEPYDTTVYVDLGGADPWLFSTCTCPVRSMCKHGAAVALAAREAAGERPPASEWERRLADFLSDQAARLAPGDDLPALALELSVEHGSSYRGSTARVRMRPLRQGAKSPWVKANAEWRDFASNVQQKAYPRLQREALVELHGALTAQHTYLYAGEVPDLSGFGDRVVPLIAQAAAAGVVLLPGRGLDEVLVAEEDVRVVTEVHRDGGTHVRLGIEHAGRLWSGADVLPHGHPARTFALRDGRTLHLVRTAVPLGMPAQRLLLGEELVVPDAEGSRLTELLAPMSRIVAVRSPDESIALPEPPRPVLSVTVTWHTSSKAEVTWDWTYDEQRFHWASRQDPTLVRDLPAESEIRARVPEALGGRTWFEGGDALSLAIHDLAALRELDDVAVVERERPDFRRAEGEPEISFRLEEPTAGNDWFDLSVQIEVGGERVPLPEVLAALTLDQEFLVLPSGLYLSTDVPEFDRLREVVLAAAELHDVDGDGLSVGRHDLGIWAQLAEIGVVDDQAAQWVAKAQALRDFTDLPRPEPTGISTPLRPYQHDGFAWLAFLWQHELGGVLADDMGLGKTLQVLALIAHARAERPEAPPFLVVAPTSVVTAWHSEAARHAPGLRVASVARTTDDVAALARNADIVLTTYTVLRLQGSAFGDLSWGGLVLDEAHHIKNHNSKTYAAVRMVDAPFRLAVTGTPFENRLMELWALLSVTVPGLYPWPRSFNDNVVKPVEKDRDARALERFRRRVKPFLLRRTKDLVAADLPPKQEQVLTVELTPRHRKLYDTHLNKERQRILGLVDEDFDKNRIAILAALTKLRQLALDPGLVDPAHDKVGSSKLELLADQLTEVAAEGHQVLIFSQFTSYLRRVEARLSAEGITTSYLDGTTRDRGAAIDRFRSGEASVFLISLKAGGVGLTLTEADYVYVLDPWWNPASEAQAVDRAHRIGQTRHVMVYRMIAEGTIEEKVMELKERKAELFAQVVDGNGEMSAGLQADDIRALFGSD